MKLNDEWDNLPQADGEEQQVNDIPLISMGSILFCRHGGIITPAMSGQEPILHNASLDVEWYIYNKNMIKKIDTIDPELDESVSQFKEVYDKNRSRYVRLAKQMGIPPELLAVIHYREEDNDYLEGKFNVYLHNGETLGSVTIKDPKGKLFYDFDEAALDAMYDQRSKLRMLGITYETRDMTAMLCFLETYNGKGYYNHQHVNPYLYSGTNVYVSGKYVSDGVYDPETVDKQIGCYVLLDALLGEEGL